VYYAENNHLAIYSSVYIICRTIYIFTVSLNVINFDFTLLAISFYLLTEPPHGNSKSKNIGSDPYLFGNKPMAVFLTQRLILIGLTQIKLIIDGIH